MKGREVFRQPTNDKRTPQQMVKSAGKRSLLEKQLMQQRQQRRLKKDLIFQPSNLARIQIHSVCLYMYSARNIPNRICKAASSLEKTDLKNRLRIVHVLSNMQNVAISSCCFVTFCKQRQRNKQRIITYAHTALCTRSRCRYSLKTNKRPNNKQPNEQKTNESLAEQKDD